MEKYVFPKLANRLVNEIELRDIEAVLRPIWYSKPNQAKCVHRRIASVMTWARIHKFRNDNPAESVLVYESLTPKNYKIKHMRSLPYQEVQRAVEQIREITAHPASKLCLEFLILTATRSQEARLADWREIDMDERLWIIPAERMKRGRMHRIPLSYRVLEILEQARSLYPENIHGLVFPGANFGNAMRDLVLSRLVKKAGLDTTVHGFRSSFRIWAEEQTNFSRAACELCLAHQNKDRTERAYMRSDLLQQREKLMDAWASYIDLKTCEGSSVYQSGNEAKTCTITCSRLIR